jgi:hypothetical protein
MFSALALMMGVAVATTAQAQQKILVDLGQTSSFRGVTAPSPDANGNSWNSVTPGLLVPTLVDTTGATTAIGLGWDTPVGTDSFNGPAGATSFPNPAPTEVAAAGAAISSPASQAALGDLAVAEAVIDFAASPGAANNNTVFDLENLDTTKTYTLKLFGSHIFSADQQTKYIVGTGIDTPTSTLTGIEGTATIDVDEIDTNDQSSPPNVPNSTQVATITGLTPNSGGVLFVDFLGANTGNVGYLNDFELIATPEPASLAICAFGCLLAVRRRQH